MRMEEVLNKKTWLSRVVYLVFFEAIYRAKGIVDDLSRYWIFHLLARNKVSKKFAKKPNCVEISFDLFLAKVSC